MEESKPFQPGSAGQKPPQKNPLYEGPSSKIGENPTINKNPAFNLQPKDGPNSSIIHNVEFNKSPDNPEPVRQDPSQKQKQPLSNSNPFYNQTKGLTFDDDDDDPLQFSNPTGSFSRVPDIAQRQGPGAPPNSKSEIFLDKPIVRYEPPAPRNLQTIEEEKEKDFDDVFS